MSEGGRKVWNREQLLALNPGTIILWDAADAWGDVYENIPLEVNACGPRQMHQFGSGGHMYPLEPQRYPIEVIWEPTEED